MEKHVFIGTAPCSTRVVRNRVLSPFSLRGGVLTFFSCISVVLLEFGSRAPMARRPSCYLGFGLEQLITVPCFLDRYGSVGQASAVSTSFFSV